MKEREEEKRETKDKVKKKGRKKRKYNKETERIECKCPKCEKIYLARINKIDIDGKIKRRFCRNCSIAIDRFDELD